MPVTQFNMKWVEPAGLVKFDFLGLKTLTVLRNRGGAAAQARHRDRSRRDPARRRRRPTSCWRAAEAVGIFQLESQGMRRALLDMRPDRFEDIIALVALYRPGPMANIPTYCARKHGMEEPDYIHPKLEPILRETFGVIVYQEQVMQARADPRRLHARRSRPPAPRDGQEDPQRRWQQQRERFVTGAVERGIERRPGRRDLRAARTLRRIRLQQEPRRGLCAGRLSDRLHEGELSGRVPGGVDDARHGQYRQARRNSAPRPSGSASRWCRRRSTARASPSTSRATRSTMRSRRSRASARQAVEAIVAARGDKPFADLSDFASRINPRAVNKRVLESLAAAGAFDALEPNRARVFAAVDTHAGGRRSARTRPAVGRRSANCSAARRRATPLRAAGGRAVAAGRAAAEGVRRHRLLPHRPSARRLCGGAQAHARAVVGRVLAQREGGRQRRPRRRHGGVARRSGAPAPAARWASSGCPIRPATTRRCCSPKGWRSSATCSSPARRCCSALSAELQGDDVRARIQIVEPLDEAAAKLQKGLRVFLRDERRSRASPSGCRDRRRSGAAATRPTARCRWC